MFVKVFPRNLKWLNLTKRYWRCLEEAPRIELNARKKRFPFGLVVIVATVGAGVDICLTKNGEGALNYRVTTDDVTQLVIEYWNTACKAIGNNTLNLVLICKVGTVVEVVINEAAPKKPVAVSILYLGVLKYLLRINQVGVGDDLARWKLGVDNMDFPATLQLYCDKKRQLVHQIQHLKEFKAAASWRL
ncbi:hypothetical protein [Nitrosomonas sp. Nm132]|uniref:hypothetical protein n=1 Tax=Nitrosomonas sp. Nm132 TaxID=1881053 RepID=UPI0015A2AF69|nr:hypothetical protein [Nitrosomonas sp. Nm132]